MPETCAGASAPIEGGRRGEVEAAASATPRDREPAGLAEAARAAARARRWDVALRRWDELLRRCPASRDAALGKGNALIELGRHDEAEAVFAALRDREPGRPAGLAGLARAAARARRWDVALQRWDELLRRFPANRDAVLGKNRALTVLGRRDEAEAFVRGLDDAHVAPDVRAEAEVDRLLHARAYDRLARLLDGHRALLTGRPRLRRIYVRALLLSGRAGEATAFIERHRTERDSYENGLVVEELLQDGRPDLAGAVLPLWTRAVAPSHLPWHLVPTFLNLAWTVGGEELSSRLIRELERALAGDPSRYRLTPTVVVQRQLAASVAMLTSAADRRRPPRAPAEAPMEEALASAVREVPAEVVGARRREIVLELCRDFRELRAGHPAFLVDSPFNVGDALETAARIVDAVDARMPFSLVRLGDGEGTFLPYRPELEPHRAEDRMGVLREFWPDVPLSPPDADRIEATLARAVAGADVVGVPDLDRLCRRFWEGPSADLPAYRRPERGLLAVVDQLTGRAPESVAGRLGHHGQVLTSCHIHQDLSFWGLWGVVLRRVGACSVVTCLPALGARLREAFGLRVSRTYLVPPEANHPCGSGGSAGARHYPDRFDELRATIEVAHRGEVFLVAAGLLGKMYCDRIKEAGGIAIDVGSAADYWCGYRTRGVHATARFFEARGVGEAYRRVAAVSPRVARLWRCAGSEEPAARPIAAARAARVGEGAGRRYS